MSLVMAAAQDETTLNDSTPKRRLRNHAIARGFIGGESHDSYVIRVRRGQTMTVQLSWRREGDNRAEFGVVESPDFFKAEPVTFGISSSDGRRWTGKVPKTGDYFIYVVAHPTAHYTLRVTLN
jgi:hypothetical protein